MTPREYWNACRLHDWQYFMSDDPGVFRDGQDAEDRLLLLAHKDRPLNDIYNQWRDYHFEAGARPSEPKMEE